MRNEMTYSNTRATGGFDLARAARALALAAVACFGFTSIACETSHSESDTPGLFGGNTHEETTTTHNPVTGTNDTSSTETKTP